LIGLMFPIFFLDLLNFAIRQALRYFYVVAMDNVMVLIADRWIDGVLGARGSPSSEALMVVRVVASYDFIDQQHHAVAYKS
jgi:hypothetical protein